MLFHTTAFILGFLPACLTGFFVLGRFCSAAWALRWLIACSLFFYGWWNPAYLPLLAGSVCAQSCHCGADTADQRDPRLADRRRRSEPGAPGLVQIRRLPAAYRRPERAGAAHHPAAGDQLLHLPADHVSGGYRARGGRGRPALSQHRNRACKRPTRHAASARRIHAWPPIAR